MSDERLIQLEIALAHHEKQIQDLNEMINLQWKEIEILKLKLDKAQKQIIEFGSMPTVASEAEPLSVAEIAAAEKPPHY